MTFFDGLFSSGSKFSGVGKFNSVNKLFNAWKLFSPRATRTNQAFNYEQKDQRVKTNDINDRVNQKSENLVTESHNLLLGTCAGRHVNVHAHGALINQFSTEHTGDPNEETAQQREVNPPRPNKCACILHAKQPVQRCKGKQHYGKCGVTPGGNQPANARNHKQVNQTYGAGNPAAQCAYTRQPEAGARPKEIVGEQVSAIGRNQADQGGDGKMNQHRVDRMAANRHFAGNGFMHGVHLSCVLLLTALLAGCSGPLSSLDPAGPSARSGALLWWGMFIYASIVLVAVVGLWLYAMKRPADARDEAAQRRVHNRWIIGGGVILPTASIFILLLFGIPMGHRMLPLPPDNGPALRVDVIGHQWWWEVRYPNSTILLTNELHIPAGVPIDIHLSTADVIHGFWVPRLGGKLDAIPGRVNVLRLEADEPGVYAGQCAEFCGLHHATMKFTVTAHTPEDFERWRKSQDSKPQLGEPQMGEQQPSEQQVEERQAEERQAEERQSKVQSND